MSAAQDNYNRAGFITFMVSMAFTFVFFIYISFIHPGVQFEKVRTQKDVSNPMAQAAGGAGAESVASNKTPWVSSEGMIAHGKKAYQSNCAFCHGATGKGDGAAGATLVPKPRNLVAGKWTADGSTIGLYKTIKNGIAGTSMAAFGHLPLVDRWAMVHFIHSITENKVMSDAAELEKFAKSEK